MGRDAQLAGRIAPRPIEHPEDAMRLLHHSLRLRLSPVRPRLRHRPRRMPDPIYGAALRLAQRGCWQ